ncbi:hypothetical protein J6590_102766, partial [Homalodisca vitripennis]
LSIYPCIPEYDIPESEEIKNLDYPLCQWRSVAGTTVSQDNRIKQRGAWLLLGWVTSERSCPCKQPACPVIGGGSEVTFKPLVPRF